MKMILTTKVDTKTDMELLTLMLKELIEMIEFCSSDVISNLEWVCTNYCLKIKLM